MNTRPRIPALFALAYALIDGTAAASTPAPSDTSQGRPLEATQGDYTPESVGWYPGIGRLSVTSDRWGNGDAYSLPAQHERGEFADQAFFQITPQPIPRARRFATCDAKIVRQDGEHMTRWVIKRRKSGQLGFRINRLMPREPEKISFAVTNRSERPVMFAPRYYETSSAHKWANVNWKIGDSQTVAPGESRVVVFDFSERKALTPERVEERGYANPVFPGAFGAELLGLQPGVRYELRFSDYTVHYGHAKDARVSRLRVPDSIRAGEPAEISLAAESADSSAVLDLEVRRDERTMWRRRLGEERKKRLADGETIAVELTLPDFLDEGDYEIGLVSGGYRARGPEPTFRFRNPKEAELPETDIATHKGRRSITVEGRSIPWIGHASISLRPADTKLFAEAGSHFIIETATGVGTTMSDDPTWNGYEKPDFSPLDQRVAMALAENPDAWIVLRPNLALPSYWKQRRPKEQTRARHVDGTTATAEVHGVPLSSFASEAWQAKQEAILRALIRHVKDQPWADRVLGFWLASRPHEWFFAGSDKVFWDYGPRSRTRFRQWAESQSWLDRVTSPESPPAIPSPETRRGDHRDFHPPTRGGNLTAAYNAYEDQLTRKVIERFARAVRDATSSRSLVGVHYGYAFVLGDTMHQGRSMTLSSYDELLRSPHIDFMAGVVAPKNWGLNSHDIYSLPFDSLGAHGKHYMVSNDLAFYFTPYPYDPFDPENLDRGDRFMQQRILANAAVHGTSPLWFGLKPTWWADRDARDTIEDMIEAYDATFSRDVTSLDEVALILDTDSYPWVQDNSRFLRNNTYLLYRTLQRTGAPLSTWDMSDLARLPERIKTVVVAFAAAAEPEALKALRELIERGGRTVIVVGRPGLIDRTDGTWDREAPSRLLDLPIRIDDDGEELGLVAKGRYRELARRSGEPDYNDADRWVGLGLPEEGRLTSPELAPVPRAVADNDALLRYENGQSAMAERPLADGGRLIWVSMAPLDSAIWREWNTQAGVHHYAPPGYFVHAGRGLVSVTAPEAGKAELRFGETVELPSDVFDPSFEPRSGRSAGIFFHRGQTRLFPVERAPDESESTDGSP